MIRSKVFWIVTLASVGTFGGIIDCGTCPSGASCGGDGVPYKCGGAH